MVEKPAGNELLPDGGDWTSEATPGPQPGQAHVLETSWEQGKLSMTADEHSPSSAPASPDPLLSQAPGSQGRGAAVDCLGPATRAWLEKLQAFTVRQWQISAVRRLPKKRLIQPKYMVQLLLGFVHLGLGTYSLLRASETLVGRLAAQGWLSREDHAALADVLVLLRRQVL